MAGPYTAFTYGGIYNFNPKLNSAPFTGPKAAGGSGGGGGSTPTNYGYVK